MAGNGTHPYQHQGSRTKQQAVLLKLRDMGGSTRLDNELHTAGVVLRVVLLLSRHGMTV
jgi:hypothetical protein